jgi:zinc transport system substrate-binding protein
LKKMKWLAVVFIAAAGALINGCQKGMDSGTNLSENVLNREESEGLQVTTTLFPYYDFVRQIAGDQVRLKLVVPAGMDSHSFEPTPADMIGIQDSDIFFYNGGEMELWVEAALESLETEELRAVSMMESVDVLEEELVEGMEENVHDSHEHRHSSYEPGQVKEIEYDEHIWTSPANAIKIVKAISQVLIEEDPAHKALYLENTRRYINELNELDQAFLQVTENRKRDMIIVGDKFPFRYLAERYQLSYRAAFLGCSGDTEPSARTIAYLIEQVRSKQLPAVYYLELSSHRVAEIIGEETGAKPLLLHSCHNVTRKEFEEGVTYLQLMKQNVKNLEIGIME